MRPTYWTVPPMWRGLTVAVLASGPSMSQAVADRVRHLPRVAVNDTWRLAPDADVIYASDGAWWRRNVTAVSCAGVKACVEIAPNRPQDVPDGVLCLRNSGRDGFDHDPACLRPAGNSGGAAIHLACHARPARILLLGFDMRGGHFFDNKEHFKATYERWMGSIELLAANAPRDVEIINCTPGSSLRCFRQMDLDEALEQREAA